MTWRKFDANTLGDPDEEVLIGDSVEEGAFEIHLLDVEVVHRC